MKGQLIVSDLDGTLLDSEHSISEHTAKWIQVFKEQDGLFTIATGRRIESTMPYIKKLQIDIPVIVSNGAQIYCPKKNKIVYEKTLSLSKEMIEKIVQASQDFAEILIFQGERTLTLRKGKLVQQFEEKEKIAINVIADEQIPSTVTKIIVMSDEKEKLLQFESEFLKQFAKSNLTYSEPNYVEILPNQVSKGNALQLVKEHIRADVQSIAFGNNMNDISLLKEADIGIAVRNSDVKLIDAADQVSEYTNNEHAVGKYIENLLTNRLGVTI